MLHFVPSEKAWAADMTGGEIKWAFMQGIPVRLIDRVRGLDIWYPNIDEVIYRRDGKRVAVSASLISRAGEAPTVTRARMEDVFFAKEEDEARCKAEMNTEEDAS